MVTRRQNPAPLLVRTNLVLGVSALLIVAIATQALYTFVINPITSQSADDQAALLVLSAQTWVELPPDARPYFELEMAENHDLIISEALRELPPAPLTGYLELLQEQLSERLSQSIFVRAGQDLLWVNIPMGGRELQIGFAAERQEIQPLYGAVVILGLGGAIVFFASFLIVQRIARPLVKVAQQAEDFRGAAEIEPLPETGPRELVSLARNFNTMAREIAALLDNRTTLLAGISHDLRTPITRMRLAVELLPDTVDDKLKQRFAQNLESMDALIGDVLRFARGTRESAQTVPIGPFVAEVVQRFEGPVQLVCEVADDYSLELAPGALSRVLVNVINNALVHGLSDLPEGHGRVDVRVSANQIRITDNGPGVPEASRQQIFQPFFRLEESRSRATGGSGLGLAIVAQLCQAHGWQIQMQAAPTGTGASVVLRLVS
ncbi:MAG: ATP-binding protein [Pseudomonadota bacterium]